MHASVTITADELADLTVRPDAEPSQGRTLVWLGGVPFNVSTWVSAADARRIAKAWLVAEMELAQVEGERRQVVALPTLAEVIADRDAAAAEAQ